jgi:hypothetical protein
VKAGWSATIVAAVALWLGADPSRPYIVRPGDTISGIARSHLGDGNRWPEIARLNGLKPPYGIRVGQRLLVPAATRGAEPEVAPAADADRAAAESEATLDVPSRAWLWAILSLAVFWLFSSLCLKCGCWFSLVEATFGRCVVLSLLLGICLVLWLAVVVGTGYLSIKGEVHPDTVPASMVVLSLAYLIGSVILTKRVLECRWRSVLTVFAMTHLAGIVIGGAVVLALFALFPIALEAQAAREFVAALFSSL